jgi:hypothetical protein
MVAKVLEAALAISLQYLTAEETEANRAKASVARVADDTAEKQPHAKEELESCEADERPLEDAFGYGDLRSLVVPIRSLPDGAPYYEETAADKRAMIANLTDPADTAMSGRFERENRDTLEAMLQGDRDAWSWDELRLSERDRELREGVSVARPGK